MNSVNSQKLNAKKAVQVVKKAVKEVLTQQGIEASTRKGNKELDLFLKKLLKGEYNNEGQLKAMGTGLGKTIATVSEQRGVKHLDKQVILQVALKEEIAIPEPIPTTTVPKIAKQAPTLVDLNRTPQVKEEVKAVTPVEEEETPAVAEFEPEAEEEETPAVAEFEPEEEEEETPAVAASESEAEEEETPTVSASEPEAEEEETPAVAASEPEEEEEETPIIAEYEPEAEEEETPAVAASEPEAEEEIAKKPSASVSLKDRIAEDIKLAMKAKDTIRLETVRGIKKAIIEKEVAVRPTGQENLTPEQELEILSQQAKQRRDSIEQYQKAQREDLADKEAQELAIIETYLPKQLTDEELQTILAEIIASTGANSAKDLGKVMGVAMQQLKGKADGKKIQELVKSQLN
jgi:uncharacterized protein YqeY